MTCSGSLSESEPCPLLQGRRVEWIRTAALRCASSWTPGPVAPPRQLSSLPRCATWTYENRAADVKATGSLGSAPGGEGSQGAPQKDVHEIHKEASVYMPWDQRGARGSCCCRRGSWGSDTHQHQLAVRQSLTCVHGVFDPQRQQQALTFDLPLILL